MRLFHVALGSLLAACVMATACGSEQRDIATVLVTPDAAPPESFGAPPDGGASDPNEATAFLCVATECPEPYTTCPGVPGVCSTNLDRDLFNCGACGNECPPFSYDINGSFFCMKGTCQLMCLENTGDCNGFIDDGCEAKLLIDPANCGTCGTKCAPGQPCFQGQCGCPKGYTSCDGECVRLSTDSANCGACGNSCSEDAAGVGACDGAAPPNSEINCRDAQCGQHCALGFADCNKDFCGDGCETRLGNDTQNCGACGHACSPGQVCAAGKCLCDPVTDPGGTYCGGTGCTDLQTDPNNCGACGNDCKGLIPPIGGYAGSPPTGSPACVLGRCTYECSAGYGNCDGHIDNGCEVDLMVDPRNCGACGNQCDLANGQPCAGGKCLTKPCDAGVVQ